MLPFQSEDQEFEQQRAVSLGGAAHRPIDAEGRRRVSGTLESPNRVSAASCGPRGRVG